METLECIKTRRSIRTYDRKDVPTDLIEKILEYGTMAPSTGNTQPWEFIVVKDREIKNKLFDASLKQEHVRDAPVLIIVCADIEKAKQRYKERGEKLYSIQNTAACIQNILLAAHDLGLGTCWVGAFEEKEVSTILEIPKRLRPVAIITLGFPLEYEKPRKIERIPYRNITWVEKYGKTWEFKPRPLDIQVKDWQKRLSELEKKLEKSKEQPISEEKESFSEKFRRIIKNITK